MAYLTTGLDLKLDALLLAGEPDNGTSDYEGVIYEWLTVVQRSLVSGGQLGPSVLQPMDWPWARAWPRGSIQLQQPFNQANTVTATFTTGNNFIILDVGASALPDLTGFRIVRTDTAAQHIIDSVNNNAVPHQIVLREPWTGDTMTDSAWMAFADSYQLPQDFVRGCSPLYVSIFPTNAAPLWAPRIINVIDPSDLEKYTTQWPGTGGGFPYCAARVGGNRLRFQPFLDTPQSPNPVQIEFEYIRRPPVIAEGTIPDIPVEHRRLLSYGAAYLIMDDKADSGATSLFQRFQMQYQGMIQEYIHDARRTTSQWGRIQTPRDTGVRPPIATETGLPIFAW